MGKKRRRRYYFGRKTRARRIYRTVKRGHRRAISKSLGLIKGLVLAGPTIAYIAEGQMNLKGSPITAKLENGLSRLCVATTGVLYEGHGKASFQPQYLLLGWGPALAYKGLSFATRAIPGPKASPFSGMAAVMRGG